MSYFERLAAVVERVVSHPDYPGKRETVDLCLEDIHGLSMDGLITDEQEDLLREALLGMTSGAA